MDTARRSGYGGTSKGGPGGQPFKECGERYGVGRSHSPGSFGCSLEWHRRVVWPWAKMNSPAVFGLSHCLWRIGEEGDLEDDGDYRWMRLVAAQRHRICGGDRRLGGPVPVDAEGRSEVGLRPFAGVRAWTKRRRRRRGLLQRTARPGSVVNGVQRSSGHGNARSQGDVENPIAFWVHPVPPTIPRLYMV